MNNQGAYLNALMSWGKLKMPGVARNEARHVVELNALKRLFPDTPCKRATKSKTRRQSTDKNESNNKDEEQRICVQGSVIPSEDDLDGIALPTSWASAQRPHKLSILKEFHRLQAEERERMRLSRAESELSDGDDDGTPTEVETDVDSGEWHQLPRGVYQRDLKGKHPSRSRYSFSHLTTFTTFITFIFLPTTQSRYASSHCYST